MKEKKILEKKKKTRWQKRMKKNGEEKAKEKGEKIKVDEYTDKLVKQTDR